MEDKNIEIEFKKIEIEDDILQKFDKKITISNDMVNEKKSVIKTVNRNKYIEKYNIPIKKEIGDLYENYILNYLIEEKNYKAWYME